jgi:hypothetical protein
LRLLLKRIVGIRLQIAAQHQPESFGEQDVAIFAALALVDEYLALHVVNVSDTDVGELADGEPMCKEKFAIFRCGMLTRRR